MQISDIRELKKYLDIDPADTAQDTKLTLMLEHAADLIAEFISRPGLFKKERTEYYAGTGTQKLCLRSRPVFTSPTILVYEDLGGYFGSVTGSFDTTNTALTYGTDFALMLDQEDGTSRSGILVKIDSFWEQPNAREVGFLSPYIAEAFGNYKVIYTAGYSYDTLPSNLRLACNLLVARLKYLFPLGMQMGSESYEERAISFAVDKDYMLGLVRPLIYPYRNWKW